MKLYQIFILFVYVSLIGCLNDDNTPCDTTTADSKSFCNNRKMSEEETNNGAKYCCFLETTILGTKASSCIPIDQKSYDDIKKFIKDLKEKTAATELSIDCNQNYLKLSLLSLLLILL